MWTTHLLAFRVWLKISWEFNCIQVSVTTATPSSLKPIMKWLFFYQRQNRECRYNYRGKVLEKSSLGIAGWVVCGAYGLRAPDRVATPGVWGFFVAQWGHPRSCDYPEKPCHRVNNAARTPYRASHARTSAFSFTQKHALYFGLHF